MLGHFTKIDSNPPVVLVLGSPDDEHAVHIHERLCDNGARSIVFDPASFPGETAISFDPRNGRGEFEFPGHGPIPFDAVRSVFWRTYNGVGPVNLPHPEQRYIAENDLRGLFESMLMRLPALWVNDWAAVHLHQTKPVQLAMVAGLGIPVPETMITNSAARLSAFAHANARTIFKPVQGGAHARDVGARELQPEALGRLRLAPVTVQEHIAGTNIRAFVIGSDVLACEIATPAVDFRDDPSPDIVAHPLSSAQAGRCLDIARALGLVWTGIDFRLTPDGRYVFLEANPSPMFMGFERHAGLPITEKLVALLIGGSGARHDGRHGRQEADAALV